MPELSISISEKMMDHRFKCPLGETSCRFYNQPYGNRFCELSMRTRFWVNRNED